MCYRHSIKSRICKWGPLKGRVKKKKKKKDRWVESFRWSNQNGRENFGFSIVSLLLQIPSISVTPRSLYNNISEILFLTFPSHHHLWEMGHFESLLCFFFVCMSLNFHLSTPFSSSAYRLNSTTTKHHHHRWRRPVSCRIITVDRHGLGDFLSVQAAVESVAKNNREHVIIKINAGDYM